MSSHRKLLILVALVLLGMFLIGHFWKPISLIWYAVILIPYTLLLGYKSMNITSNFYLNAYSQADKVLDKKVSLTFDDGPDPIHTNMVLDVLKKYRIKATFFCIGKKILDSDKTLKRINDEGHIVGNHSFRHDPVFDFFPPFMIKKDLQKTNALILKNINKKPLLFRPPFGVTTPSMGLAVRDLKNSVIGWNNRSYDTVDKNEEAIIDRIIKNLKPGGIILLHDILPMHQSLLPRIIESIQNLSYDIVPLTELLQIKAYEE